MKNIFKASAIFLLFALTASCAKAQAKIDIFDGNIFENIFASPEHYKNRNFVIREYTSEEYGDYSARAGANIVITVENAEVKIVYWGFENEYRINSLEIKSKTKICTWGIYIGEKSENILKNFVNIPDQNDESVIGYLSLDWQYTINFKLKNKLVYEIFIGVNP